MIQKKKKKKVNVAKELYFSRILEYSGFDNPGQRTRNAGHGFKSYDNTLTLGDSDIVKLSKGFYNMTINAGNISFGLRQTNILKTKIHRAQDFRRIRQIPSLVRINNTYKFCTAIEIERKRARIIKNSLEELDSLRKADNTGNTK